jgi:hypothetical protein
MLTAPRRTGPEPPVDGDAGGGLQLNVEDPGGDPLPRMTAKPWAPGSGLTQLVGTGWVKKPSVSSEFALLAVASASYYSVGSKRSVDGPRVQ